MAKNSLFTKILVSKGVVSEDSIRVLLEKYREDAYLILLHLAQTGVCQKSTLGRYWADSLELSYVELRSTLFQRKIVQLLPEAFARKHHIIFVYQFGDAITAALSDPTDQLIIKQAEEISGRVISPVFSFPEEIEEAIEVEYKSEDQLRDLSRKIVTDTIRIEDITELTKDQLHKIAGTQAVVEFVHGLLILAIRERASDVHIEPGVEKVKVRFRIDGLLEERSRMEKTLLAPVVSRLKILAALDITERRRPQDGAITLKLPNRLVDFRMSTVPTIYGEKVVLRILGQSITQDVPDLSQLSFSKSNLEIVKRILDAPHGIFLVTGPTGSGKSTSLFAMLKYLNKPGINIVTIEDPVEYKLEGITQVQVNPGVDLQFASALRSFLRQDPDIILVGEIRDVETAQIACQAALTGHLVLATLHTNNAVQAVTRLIDMGVKPFLVAPSLLGVLSQRLVRKICDNCKEMYTTPADGLKDLFIWEGRDVRFFRGKGCSQCNETGYQGRIAIHETLHVDDTIRSMISREDSVSDIKHVARKAGFQNVRYDGMKKALRGLTTLEEVNRVTIADEDSVQPSSGT
jgi:type IV pilus assembly protein PilB